MRLTDVIRAALGEVEDYQRVTVRGVEPATIIGSAAADLAHLLAELIENALVFSPPDQTVDIRGRNRPDGYTLAIIDSGLGMPAGDVAVGQPAPGGGRERSPSPRPSTSGHYVAGNLAARHDIRVTLDNSPGNGITATIDIPPALLTTDSELAAVPAPPGRKGVGDAAARAGARAPGRGRDGPRRVDVRGRPGVRRRQPATGWPRSAPPPALTGPARAPEPAPPTRTASGLVKRSPPWRPSQAPAASMPDGDLLASLSSITDNLPRWRPGPAGARDPLGPGRPPGAPAHQPVDAAGPRRAPGHEPLVAGAARPRAPAGGSRRARPRPVAEPRRERSRPVRAGHR